MISKTILHYKILEKLGEGGMGVVYKAEDTRLKREVAIKFLPRQIAASEEERERFKIEAQAAAALNHPNIATIHAIEEVDDELFIVMEYIKGKELKQIIDNNQLSIDNVLNYATQIASGLQAAHEKGIIHRDIKSSNIMITDDGQVKIMDFGLAKLTGRTQLTRTGSTMGTVAYMSPEQTEGLETDHRTDIWAFGVVLYEMLTGQLPFRGDYEQAVIYAILNEEPELTDQIPANLRTILQKTLAKKRDVRYPNIGEVFTDLTAFSTGTKSVTSEPVGTSGHSLLPGKRWFLYGGLAALLLLAALAYFGSRSRPIESIAVMPFVNASGNDDVEYLSDGMTETLISSLSQLPKLNVKARSSVFRYKGREFDLQKIARELKVQAILTGRVVERGEQLTLSLELVDAATENALWSEQYNRKHSDLISLQSEIAHDVSSKLKTKLSGTDEQKLAKTYTANPEAYHLYLKGRYHAGKYTPEGFSKGIEYFNQAIAVDPTYALAYDGLAYCYYVSWYISPKEAGAKGKAAARKALEIDPTLAEAYTSLAAIYAWYDYDWSSAEGEFQQALHLNPDYALAHGYYAAYLAAMGRFDEAIAEGKRAAELEPLSAELNTTLGIVYFYAAQYEQAFDQLNKTIQFEPNFWWAHTYLARTLEKKGKLPDAISVLERAKLMEGATPEVLAALGYAYAAAGKRGEAHKIIAHLKEQAEQSYVPPYDIAVIYIGLEEKEQAFAYLEKEYATGGWYLNFLKVDPDLDPLRPDPRFKEMLKRLNLSE
ncbi:MAG: FlgO family outer membrane protein [bacterium]